MGNSFGSNSIYRRELAVSKEISERLKRDFDRESIIVKVLLLGKDEDSIFIRQLKVLYGLRWDDLSIDERMAKREDVFRAVVVNMASLLEIADGNEAVDEPLKHRLYDESNRCVRGGLIEMDDELINCLQRLWDNQTMQAALTEMRNGSGHESVSALEYFMEHSGRILNRAVAVTDADSAYATPTRSRRGVVSLDYTLHGVRYRLYDGRSLQGERRKWLYMFENVTALFYLVPINEFDETLYEDPSVNVLNESMLRLETLVNSEYFRRAITIVFFTNTDLFREKLQIKPIRVVDAVNPRLNRWTDFEGFAMAPETRAEVDEAFDAALNYSRDKFEQLFNDRHYQAIYMHPLELRNLDNFDRVLPAISDIILRRGMTAAGLIV